MENTLPLPPQRSRPRPSARPLVAPSLPVALMTMALTCALLTPVPCHSQTATSAATSTANRAASGPVIDGPLAERIRTMLKAAVVPPKGPARIEFELGTLNPRLRLAPCRQVEPYLPSVVPLWGHGRVGLRCVDGDRLWNVSLPVTVKVFAQAVVLNTALPAGTTIGEQHLTLAEVDLAAASAPSFDTSDEVVGRLLVRPLPAGSTLRATDLRQRQWFAAGDQVKVIARGDGFVVVGGGQALSAGIEGMPAKVRAESGRILVGQPVGVGRIEVSL